MATIAESRGQKDDERDAYKIAEQLRTGAFKQRVFKDVGQYKSLRELARVPAMVVRDSVRVHARRRSHRARSGSLQATVDIRGPQLFTRAARSPTARERALATHHRPLARHRGSLLRIGAWLYPRLHAETGISCERRVFDENQAGARKTRIRGRG